MRVLVCGGRSYGSFGRSTPGSPDYGRAFAERGVMCRALDAVVRQGATVIIHGGARGADAYASKYADDHGLRQVQFSAEWQRHGKAAGPLRNAKMISEGKPDLVIAFPGARGTADCVRQAEAAGIPIVRPSPARPTQEAG